MKEKRIYQISKELNISHHEIIKFVENNGFSVSNHMMPVTNEIYSLILTEFSKDTNEVFSINWLTNQIHIQINNILN